MTDDALADLLAADPDAAARRMGEVRRLYLAARAQPGADPARLDALLAASCRAREAEEAGAPSELRTVLDALAVFRRAAFGATPLVGE